MLPTINLISNRDFTIKNFEEDKAATLNENPGLRYIGTDKKIYMFRGDFYLTNQQNELIESFEVCILVEKNYPNSFPVVILLDDKIEKNNDYHVDQKDSTICLEHPYIINYLTRTTLRLYDFINYYLPRYFSWVLVKKYGDVRRLQEWDHHEKGTKQFYETLLGTTDKKFIFTFLENYCRASKIRRNDKCYCQSDTNLKYCHYNESLFLKNTPKSIIKEDIKLFN